MEGSYSVVHGAEREGSEPGRTEVQIETVAGRNLLPAVVGRPPCGQRTAAQLWAPEGGEDELQFCGSGFKARAG
jgi:hypothetical protein